jgi:MscS family membrane protein
MGCKTIAVKFIRASLVFVWLAFFLSAGLLAQEEGPPRDALDRGTPYGSAKGFLLAAGARDFETAANYLDLRNLPAQVSAEGGKALARKLDFVLSRAVVLDDYILDDTPSGEQGDGLPDYRDLLARIPTDKGETELYMQRVPRDDGVMIWKVSNRSVAEIPNLHAYYANPEWVERIREKLPGDTGFLGLELYKWVIGIGAGLIAWPVFYLIGVLLSRLFLRPDHHLYTFVRGVLTRPAVALAILLLVGFVVKELGMGALAQKYADTRTIFIIVVIWMLWSIVSLFQKFKHERLLRQGREGAARLLRPFANLIRLLLVLVGLLFWLSNIGVNISTVLAGLGVGGLALALALQKPLEDLMGALTLFSQQPIRVGDFCKYGEVLGSVEEIGLRTTRIRTLANTVVCVPNSLIAHSEIENYSARNKFFYKPTIRLSYGSSRDQIRDILKNIEQMLHDHERVLDDIVRVRFREFSEDAILIKVQCYVDCENVTEFFEISEELNLKIMKIVEDHSASFALPGMMIYGTPQNHSKED